MSTKEPKNVNTTTGVCEIVTAHFDQWIMFLALKENDISSRFDLHFIHLTEFLNCK